MPVTNIRYEVLVAKCSNNKMRGDLSKRRNIWSTNNFAFLKADDDLISMVMMVIVMVIMVMMIMVKRLMLITVGVLALFLKIPLVNGYFASGNLVSVHIRAIRT